MRVRVRGGLGFVDEVRGRGKRATGLLTPHKLPFNKSYQQKIFRECEIRKMHLGMSEAQVTTIFKCMGRFKCIYLTNKQCRTEEEKNTHLQQQLWISATSGLILIFFIFSKIVVNLAVMFTLKTTLTTLNTYFMG